MIRELRIRVSLVSDGHTVVVVIALEADVAFRASVGGSRDAGRGKLGGGHKKGGNGALCELHTVLFFLSLDLRVSVLVDRMGSEDRREDCKKLPKSSAFIFMPNTPSDL